jgi:hypothetical protein
MICNKFLIEPGNSAISGFVDRTTIIDKISIG